MTSSGGLDPQRSLRAEVMGAMMGLNVSGPQPSRRRRFSISRSV